MLIESSFHLDRGSKWLDVKPSLACSLNRSLAETILVVSLYLYDER